MMATVLKIMMMVMAAMIIAIDLPVVLRKPYIIYMTLLALEVAVMRKAVIVA
jgi:hypothetical protein